MKPLIEKLNRAIENPMHNYAHRNVLDSLDILRKHCKTESIRLQLENYITTLKGCDYYYLHQYLNAARIPEFVLLCVTIKAFIENAIRQGSIA